MSREQFEAWARPLWRHREDFDQRIGAAPGTYNNYEVQAAWKAWQESAKQEREECAAFVERDCADNQMADPRELKEVAAAIRAGDGRQV